jgi:hypothetical protein
MTSQLLGLATGFAFGFLLQKGRVLRFDKQLAAMRLQDMTILKFMLSAILVGMVGLHVLQALGVLAFSHKPMNVGAVVLGGILFGAGWAVTGFCPGTAVGAVGEGRWHALFAVLGMIVGAAVYAELYPWLQQSVLAWKNFGRIGVPETLGVSPWLLIPLFWAGILALFAWFEKQHL